MASALMKLGCYRRIVVKIGSSLLVEPEIGVRADWLAALAADIANLRGRGVEVLVVSSGAIALGRSFLGLHTPVLALDEAQALAAIGQIELAHCYAQAFKTHQLRTGQILLTLGDTQRRRSYLNARATINRLLKLGIVPILNENDTVATNEIRYGDNDRLSALVASMIGADLLILLSDIDGLYSASPHLDSKAHLIREIVTITGEIEAMAGSAASYLSRGGMKTKIEAAKIATSAGCAMLIASGKYLHPLAGLDAGADCSFFYASSKPVNAWKQWITGHIEPAGQLVIDDGALQALMAGKSLLPAGVTQIFGQFERGDTVAIINVAGEEIGRGLVAYDAQQAELIIGHKTEEIAVILGLERRGGALVHRNDMVLHGC